MTDRSDAERVAKGRPTWMGRKCPTPSTCNSYGRCMPIINVQCGLNPYEPGFTILQENTDAQ
jgi:hypothetical protein